MTSGEELGRREGRRVAVQAELDAERSQAERNRMGQFATPAALARDIAEYAVSLTQPEAPIRFLEPALGSGSFFSALLQSVPAERVESGWGVELDTRFAAAAQRVWGDFGLEVVEGDFTSVFGDLPRANLILTNPPYVRHHHLDPDRKRRLRAASAVAGLSVNGLSGLYVYFVALSHLCMDDGAVAAWLIPSEFMDVNYGSALRDYLSRRVELIRIHRFDPEDAQFEDALVSSAVVVFRNRRPAPGGAAQLTFGGTMMAPAKAEEVPVESLRKSRKWTTYPRAGEGRAGEARAAGKAVALGDLFKIRRGIATGANRFFIMELRRARRLGLPAERLKPILPSPRHLTADVIEALPDGYPDLSPALVVIDCDKQAEEVQTRWPSLWRYLETGAAEGIRDRYLMRNRAPWYRQERRDPPPFLCTYMGRAKTSEKPFRLIWNKSSAIAANVYLLLYPIGPLAATLENRPDLAGAVFDALSSLEPREMKEEGRVYGGGLHKIEPAELARVPAETIMREIAELGQANEADALLPGAGEDRQIPLWA